MPEPAFDLSSNGAQPRERGCALVTGAARGIGAAVAEMLAAEGWPVGVNYQHDADGASATAERIVAEGGVAVPIAADVADPAAVEAMFDELEARFGPALVLVNNAGTRDDRLAAGLDADRWARVIDVNLNGTFHTMHRALGPMVRRRFGRIVNVSSISARRPMPGQAAYSASKAGIEALTRTTALEVARRRVTVNAVAPGLVATGFVHEMTDEWEQAMPARRAAAPDEIAGCVRYLVSEEAAYVNGAVLTIDSGLSAGLLLVRSGRSSRQVKQ